MVVRGIVDSLGEYRRRVLEELSLRGLVSLMSDTKWSALVAAIDNELVFPPAFQRKDVLREVPEPANFMIE